MERLARMTNIEVAATLYEVAELLEIKGSRFKPRAYRRAAQAIETLPEDIAVVYREGRLKEVPGVGESIAEKVGEIIETGALAYLTDLRKDLPEGVAVLTGLEGVGPKKALILNRLLGIRTIDELEAAARAGEIRNVPGFGEKTEQNILQSIRMSRSARQRYLLGDILPIARDIVERLTGLDVVRRVSLAGSIRRRKETIGDVDILATSRDADAVMGFFLNLPGVARVLARGTTKSSVVLATGTQVDLRVVDEGHFGSALQYFTGSKEHNISLRRLALAKNWRLNEYGLIDLATGATIAGGDEAGVYSALGLSYIEPELREDRGEIDAAKTGNLPDLVPYGSIKGDLHVHTRWSEGAHSIEEMVESARALGYGYIAVCDHAKSLAIAHGLDEKKLAGQMREIERINRSLDGDFTVLSGIECNIDADGNPDLSNEALKDLDVVMASVHSGFKQPEAKLTDRVISAMQNEHVDVIGHPTGRILQKRKPYRINLETVFDAASALGVLMEINAYPSRLDLSDIDCFKARNHHVRFSLGSDAHSRENLRFMEFGVATARRGWLEAKDIVNTLSIEDLRKAMRS
jgi:DNA polymerase (family X)